MKLIESINDVVNNFVWGWPALILLAFVGILMTCLTGFFQLTHIGHWMKNTIGAIFKDKDVTGHTKDRSISQFQSLCTALAATVGTGNIVGVAGAIIVGGPGAVFWMWVIAFFGMMTNYSENVLGIYYRRKNSKDEWSGGAMYYLKDGLGAKKGCKVIGAVLAALFSAFCLLASFGIGNMTQVNSISGNMQSVFGIPTWITGIIVLIAVGLVVVGGLKRIASVTEKIVPFMVVIYIVGSVVIFFANISQVGHVFGAIFKGAFALSAAGGGIVGYGIKLAIEQGMKRGVFSNEAGLGSSVMVHSNSNVKEPVRQGMWGIFEVFADTIVVCTLTAFSVLSSGLVNLDNGEAAAFINQTTQVSYYEAETVSDIPDWVNSLGENQNVIFYEDHNGNLTFAQVTDENGAETPYFADLTTGEASAEYTDSTLLAITKANMVSTVFSLHFKKAGAAFVAIAIMLFAFSTVLGWSHYGSKACEYLFGEKITMVYKVIFVVLVYGGAVMGDNLAWELADTFNGLMMLPNLIGVLVLSPLVAKITRNYVDRHLKGKNVEPMLSVFPEIQKAHADAVKHGAE
jgi:AGCS family alanine or glycine:cation symporter